MQPMHGICEFDAYSSTTHKVAGLPTVKPERNVTHEEENDELDSFLMRIVDIISSIPWMILVTVVSIFLKPGLQAIIIVIGMFSWMEIARLVRAETLSVKEREYVLYAISIGESPFKIILRHIIPSVSPTIIIASTSGIAGAIMTESSLSFLGLGIQQPMSSWQNIALQFVMKHSPNVQKRLVQALL